MTGVRLLRLDEAAAMTAWAELCGPADLFNAPAWLAVEREAVGPWVPRANGCLVRAEGETVLAGVTVQQFGLDVDDETVRLDKMFPADSPVLGHPAEVLAGALQPSLMCGTWFNSSILTPPHAPAGRTDRARQELVDAVVDLADDWGSAAVFFPFVDAADTGLRRTLREAGFVEFAAPARHIFECGHGDYDEFVASLPSRKRNRLRREFAAVERAGVRTAVEPLDATTVDHAARLAHLLEQKYGQCSSYEQFQAWFDAIARHTEALVFTAARDAGPPVAMSMWIHHQGRLYGFHAGFDYERCQGLPMYSLVGYHLPMRYGFADAGTSVLEYGVGSDEAKRLRGTTALPQVLCVKALSRRARLVLDDATA
ncbi:GNAT family N-acetyltransferase [Micromonospora humidisoli]|uniref:GNAT family N-acetyltransferase n=1 Tax=Micromonospora humidisoli TaxID=2807622 RepID=A0ABS2JE15_9ACTN|nr:GNAT family N-acetyltransferase [Micromonospora humidisoli]MBM7084777.1 GNAT family N-acetyltransferase [Micromonospora humidisoli]